MDRVISGDEFWKDTRYTVEGYVGCANLGLLKILKFDNLNISPRKGTRTRRDAFRDDARKLIFLTRNAYFYFICHARDSFYAEQRRTSGDVTASQLRGNVKRRQRDRGDMAGVGGNTFLRRL